MIPSTRWTRKIDWMSRVMRRKRPYSTSPVVFCSATVRGLLNLLTGSARSNGDGGQAVNRKDEHGSTAKAKKDHPEAPDVVLGMQDERGRKGQ